MFGAVLQVEGPARAKSLRKLVADWVEEGLEQNAGEGQEGR